MRWPELPIALKMLQIVEGLMFDLCLLVFAQKILVD
jgi:hypothetical protein